MSHVFGILPFRGLYSTDSPAEAGDTASFRGYTSRSIHGSWNWGTMGLWDEGVGKVKGVGERSLCAKITVSEEWFVINPSNAQRSSVICWMDLDKPFSILVATVSSVHYCSNLYTF